MTCQVAGFDAPQHASHALAGLVHISVGGGFLCHEQGRGFVRRFWRLDGPVQARGSSLHSIGSLRVQEIAGLAFNTPPPKKQSGASQPGVIAMAPYHFSATYGATVVLYNTQERESNGRKAGERRIPEAVCHSGGNQAGSLRAPVRCGDWQALLVFADFGGGCASGIRNSGAGFSCKKAPTDGASAATSRVSEREARGVARRADGTRGFNFLCWSRDSFGVQPHSFLGLTSARVQSAFSQLPAHYSRGPSILLLCINFRVRANQYFRQPRF